MSLQQRLARIQANQAYLANPNLDHSKRVEYIQKIQRDDDYDLSKQRANLLRYDIDNAYITNTRNFPTERLSDITYIQGNEKREGVYPTGIALEKLLHMRVEDEFVDAPTTEFQESVATGSGLTKKTRKISEYQLFVKRNFDIVRDDVLKRNPKYTNKEVWKEAIAMLAKAWDDRKPAGSKKKSLISEKNIVIESKAKPDTSRTGMKFAKATPDAFKNIFVTGDNRNGEPEFNEINAFPQVKKFYLEKYLMENPNAPNNPDIERYLPKKYVGIARLIESEKNAKDLSAKEKDKLDKEIKRAMGELEIERIDNEVKLFTQAQQNAHDLVKKKKEIDEAHLKEKENLKKELLFDKIEKMGELNRERKNAEKDILIYKKEAEEDIEIYKKKAEKEISSKKDKALEELQSKKKAIKEKLENERNNIEDKREQAKKLLKDEYERVKEQLKNDKEKLKEQIKHEERSEQLENAFEQMETDSVVKKYVKEEKLSEIRAQKEIWNAKKLIAVQQLEDLYRLKKGKPTERDLAIARQPINEARDKIDELSEQEDIVLTGSGLKKARKIRSDKGIKKSQK